MSNYGDTPQHDKDLCQTCAHMVQVIGRSFKEERKFCKELSSWQHPLPPVVTKCGLYVERTKMTRWEMERVAWILEVNKKKDFIGFRPPKDSRDDRPWE